MIKKCSDYLLKAGMDTIVPITMSYLNNKLSLECYPELEDICGEFYRKTNGVYPFSDEYVNYLLDLLKPFFEKYGYTPETTDENEVRFEFVVTPNTLLNKNAILPDSKKINYDDDDSLLEVTTDQRIDESDDYDYLGYGISVNGKLVSVCCENSHCFEENNITEIGVETVENYRKKGYAASNIVSLCADLLKKGCKRIIYECDSSNIASKLTAIKAGLDYNADKYYIIAHK